MAEVCFLALWPVKRYRAGKTLLQLSRTRGERVKIGVGAMIAVVGLIELIEGTDPVLGALSVLGAPILVAAGLVGVQLTTEGILKFELFVPWSDVRSFEWSTVALSVAAEEKPQLVELLRQHLDASLPD